METSNNARKFSIVNKETGEIIRELKDGDKIISKKQSEAYKSKAEPDNRHFAFGKMKRMKEISQKLDAKKCGYIMRLIPYMQCGTGYLIKEEGSVMKTKTDLAKGLGVSKVSSRNNIIDALMDASALELDEIGYKINPDVHISGTITGNELIKLFKTTLDKLANDLKPAELGYLYKVLPYVHYQTNLICIDPFESDPANFKFLNQKEVAEVIGIDVDNARKFLNKCHKKRILFEGSTSDRREKQYYVNPYIFYRKKGYPDDTLKSMFLSSPYSPKKNTR
ncbi:hypothetical protein M3196_00320 [Fictibacillus nanhaiensis]|uniref:hypothetical protein n=1 Tax=Fictibacillus nanhaiensis TaxID=742169 RepID=UPI00203D95A6|nr:hypothetical protein [Fictibacillus nanhaiensis]MCM3730112.1 hypothetical protein [Fictibacillus nanhaiensis]